MAPGLALSRLASGVDTSSIVDELLSTLDLSRAA
jgi:hypothetical protein